MRQLGHTLLCHLNPSGSIDHLSSASVVMDDTGTLLSENRYMPFGEVRDIEGLTAITETDFGFTGQRNYAGFGLMDYNARFYSPTLGRFTQPDTIVPDPASAVGFDRYAYVNNNPLKYVDPSGHAFLSSNNLMLADTGGNKLYSLCETCKYGAPETTKPSPVALRQKLKMPVKIKKPVKQQVAGGPLLNAGAFHETEVSYGSGLLYRTTDGGLGSNISIGPFSLETEINSGTVTSSLEIRRSENNGYEEGYGIYHEVDLPIFSEKPIISITQPALSEYVGVYAYGTATTQLGVNEVSITETVGVYTGTDHKTELSAAARVTAAAPYYTKLGQAVVTFIELLSRKLLPQP